MGEARWHSRLARVAARLHYARVSQWLTQYAGELPGVEESAVEAGAFQRVLQCEAGPADCQVRGRG